MKVKGEIVETTKYKGIEIKIYYGDITKLEVDAIVNAANTKLIMGGGVAGAIKKAGGEEIEREAMKKAPIRIGEAVETTAGKLKAKYVIHTPTMELDFKTDENKIKLATRAALKKAQELGVRSIAFPALGTGVGGFPKSKSAEIMIGEIKSFIDNIDTTKEELRTIILADINEKQIQEFRNAIKALINHI